MAALRITCPIAANRAAITGECAVLLDAAGTLSVALLDWNAGSCSCLPVADDIACFGTSSDGDWLTYVSAGSLCVVSLAETRQNILYADGDSIMPPMEYTVGAHLFSPTAYRHMAVSDLGRHVALVVEGCAADNVGSGKSRLVIYACDPKDNAWRLIFQTAACVDSLTWLPYMPGDAYMLLAATVNASQASTDLLLLAIDTRMTTRHTVRSLPIGHAMHISPGRTTTCKELYVTTRDAIYAIDCLQQPGSPATASISRICLLPVVAAADIHRQPLNAGPAGDRGRWPVIACLGPAGTVLVQLPDGVACSPRWRSPLGLAVVPTRAPKGLVPLTIGTTGTRSVVAVFGGGSSCVMQRWTPGTIKSAVRIMTFILCARRHRDPQVPVLTHEIVNMIAYYI